MIVDDVADQVVVRAKAGSNHEEKVTKSLFIPIRVANNGRLKGQLLEIDVQCFL